ncbi:MAG: transposase, partial [Chitinophagaceae bacterium]
ALEGNYNEVYIFLLQENLKMWELHQQQISIIDSKIEMLLKEVCKGKKPVEVTGKAKPIRHHSPKIKDLHTMMVQLYGLDMSSISGFNDYTLLRLVGETGVDLANRFPTYKHFVSWCGLSPKHHQSGKMKKRIKGTSCNQTGQIFKEMAQGLLNSKHIAIGSFMRRLRGKTDSGIAIKAGARKLAIAYYNGSTKGTEYVEQGIKKYEEQLRQRELSTLQKLAKKHNMQISENKQVV